MGNIHIDNTSAVDDEYITALEANTQSNLQLASSIDALTASFGQLVSGASQSDAADNTASDGTVSSAGDDTATDGTESTDGDDSDNTASDGTASSAGDDTDSDDSDS